MRRPLPHPQYPLDSHMNMADFNFPPPMTQSRHAVLWPHHPPAEAMGFSTDDAGDFYSNQDTNRTTWPDTGPNRTQSGYESNNNTRITDPNLSVDDHLGHDDDLDDDEDFQTSLHIAAEGGHDNMIGLLLNSGYHVDEIDRVK